MQKQNAEFILSEFRKLGKTRLLFSNMVNGNHQHWPTK